MGANAVMPGGPAAGMRRDVAAFDVFAPVYDRLMWSADETALRKGLSCAERDVERCVEVGGGSGRAAQSVDAAVLDPARGMVERARGRGLETIRASAESTDCAARPEPPPTSTHRSTSRSAHERPFRRAVSSADHIRRS